VAGIKLRWLSGAVKPRMLRLSSLDANGIALQFESTPQLVKNSRGFFTPGCKK
jgi:hypothetical protein